MNVVLLAGGLGGARLAPALARALAPARLAVVANVGDDLEWMGLRVCPDLDSITYSLAGIWDRERGWGRRGETFVVRDGLRALGALAWFGVGDGDLALHLERARRLRDGQSLTDATRAIAARLGIDSVDLLPASDRPCPTRVHLEDGRTLEFQEWYVREEARPAVAEILHCDGPASAAALAALGAADAVVLAPSNPLTSIGPILALGGMTDAVRGVKRRLAVSPVVASLPPRSQAIEHHARARSQALRSAGSADRPAAIAARYVRIVERFVLDRADLDEADAIRALGLEVTLADTLDDEGLATILRDLVVT